MKLNAMPNMHVTKTSCTERINLPARAGLLHRLWRHACRRIKMGLAVPGQFDTWNQINRENFEKNNPEGIEKWRRLQLPSWGKLICGWRWFSAILSSLSVPRNSGKGREKAPISNPFSPLLCHKKQTPPCMNFTKIVVLFPLHLQAWFHVMPPLFHARTPLVVCLSFSL